MHEFNCVAAAASAAKTLGGVLSLLAAVGEWSEWDERYRR
jgi:hypothetical protein